MDRARAPYKERPSQGTGLTGGSTSQSEARMGKPKSSEGTHQTRVTLLPGSLRSCGKCSPNPWAAGERRDGSAMDREPQVCQEGAAGEQNARAQQNSHSSHTEER